MTKNTDLEHLLIKSQNKKIITIRTNTKTKYLWGDVEFDFQSGHIRSFKIFSF